MRGSITRPKPDLWGVLAQRRETRVSRSAIAARVYRRSIAPKSLSVFTGWTEPAHATKEVPDWAYRSRTGASEHTAAKSSWNVTSLMAALSVSGCRVTGRLI